MSTLTTVLITIIITLTITTSLVIFSKIKKGTVEEKKIFKKAHVILDGAEGVIKLADGIAPGNPFINILKVVEKYAHTGVHQAEQLYIASNLNADQRNAKARETIYAALNLLKIKRTPEIDKIINGAIEAEVLALGHKDTPEAERQIEKEKLQEQLEKLKTENTQLNDKIATIQNAVA